MNIEWFDANKPLPMVTIAPYGMNLNASAAEMLKGAAKVKLGLDTEKRKVYLKASGSEEEGAFSLPNVGDKTSSARISCKEFIQFVAIRTNLNTNQSDKFYAIWDEEIKMLVVDLTKKMTRSKPRKLNEKGAD